MPLRVYADRSHYSEPHRKNLCDILKALWNELPAGERRAKYGARADVFEYVSVPEAADVHLLPMRWQHYVDQGQIPQALHAVDAARKVNKPLAVFSLTDFEANFPAIGPDIHVFQQSAYRSRSTFSNHAIPAFFADPLPAGASIAMRDKGPRALVGFCGQGGTRLTVHAGRLARQRLARVRWRLGLQPFEPPPLEHTWFRREILRHLEANDAIDTKFIVRTKYRAGVKGEARNADPTRQEFLENIIGTDYTACMRGGGNFSVRFYEALALGRIPLFIDTDCVLPYERRIDWRRYVVWVDESEIARAGDILASFHRRLSNDEFHELQRECRQLWEDRLTSDGFYRHFHEHFPELER